MECILWNKKKTPDYKCTFLGEEPILFVGELFDNSSCLITDANNNNKPVEDYEYGKIEHAIRGNEEVESISFVEIYQQKYATGKLDLSNYVYDNRNNCNVYYNRELLDPDTTNQVPFNSSNFDKNKLEIIVTRFIDSNSAIYPTNNIIWSFSENESTKTGTLTLQTITGVYLGKNGSKGFPYQSPKNYIEVPKLKNNSPSYTGKNLNESILPDNLDTDNINYLIKNASGESIENIIEAGDYQIIFSLKDKVSNAWKTNENTISTEDQISSCKVEKKQIDISCNESLEVILNPNSSVTKNITLSETLNNLTFSISNSGLSYITAKQENEKIIFSSQDFTVDTATTTIYVELNMNNYQSNRLGFQIKLSLFNWEKATWKDLKELCKKGNLEAYNFKTDCSLTKTFDNDNKTAILIQAKEKRMVFAIKEPVFSTSTSTIGINNLQWNMVLQNYLKYDFEKDSDILPYVSTIPIKIHNVDTSGNTYYNKLETTNMKLFPLSYSEIYGVYNFWENSSNEQTFLLDTDNLFTSNNGWKDYLSSGILLRGIYGYNTTNHNYINPYTTEGFSSVSYTDISYILNTEKEGDSLKITYHRYDSGRKYVYILGCFIIDGEEETANG